MSESEERQKRLTFRAQDEVVNVGPGGHARALAALLDDTSRGHHLNVDHLRKSSVYNSDLKHIQPSRCIFKLRHTVGPQCKTWTKWRDNVEA